MSRVTIPSYEGSSPFIYVYYAEDDTRLALPVLARLYNEGLRMWSWNGCSQPTEVRAAQRISSCAALIVFLSENLDRDIQRGNFEAMEALRCNKVKYFVRLSDVELPFDWGKSDANVIIDYVRSNEAAFWLSIYDSDLIESCRGAWPSEPVNVGMSAYDMVDSSEVSDEYSNIIKIIGKIPALDRSGSPVSADDIALFAGAGEYEEPVQEEEPEPEIELPTEDLNQKSMQDLFGMLDDISLSARRKADELREAAEKRREEQEQAALVRASLPFEQDSVKTVLSDEPIVPAISFTGAALTVEEMAAEMFSSEIIDLQFDGEVFEAEEDSAEIIIIEEVPEKADETEPSFEEFIDNLTEENFFVPEIVIPEEPVSEPEEEPQPEPIEEFESVSLPTHPKTVEITEESSSALLPPASGSLTGFTLPDDNYIGTVYIINEDETDPAPTAAERAAAAEKNRKQFESALEKAAYKVTGRIVARQRKGTRSVGLRVRSKPKAVRLTIPARVKTVKPAHTPASKEKKPAQKVLPESNLSRAERRARRNRRSAEQPAAAASEPQSRKLTVVPEPMRGAMPVSAVVSQPAPPAQTEKITETAETSEAPSRRKKRHPHNSSGLLDILREMRSQKPSSDAPVSEAASSEASSAQE